MGRYSQSRRRGRSPSAASGLAAPPAPVLSNPGGDVFQAAQGADDTGGTVRLYGAEYTEGPYYLLDEDTWAATVAWGLQEQWPGQFLRATEVGNGIAYQGESEPSNVLAPA